MEQEKKQEKKQEKFYLARYGRVWRNKKTKKVTGDKLTLAENETLAMYEQISKPKDEEKPKEKDDKATKGPSFLSNKSENN